MSIAALASLGIDDPVALVQSYAAKLAATTGFRITPLKVPQYKATPWSERHTERYRNWRREYQKRRRLKNLEHERALGRARANRWRLKNLDLVRKRNRECMRRLRARRARAGK